MHEGLTPAWRAWLEKQHSAFLDELASRISAEIDRASGDAVATARAEVEQRVAETREQARLTADRAERLHLQAMQAATDAHSRELQEALRKAADQQARELQALTEQHARTRNVTPEQLSQARTAAADVLHQSVRRLRQTTGDVEVLGVLNELCAPFSRQSVVVVFENNQAHAVAMRGLSGSASDSELSFEIAAAPAVVAAIESRDPVVALLTPGELSAPLAEAFGGDPASRVSLFPILTDSSVVAMAIAVGPVSAPSVELLCDAAGMRLESIEQPSPHATDSPFADYAAPPAPPARAPEPIPAYVPAPPPPAPRPPLEPEEPLLAGPYIPRAARALGGVSAPVAPVSAPSPSTRPAPAAASGPPAWEQLDADEQRIHLQAQRMARVRTAEMRLYQNDALHRGSGSGSIYSMLKPQIDAARSEYLERYISLSPTMVDYLHLEIVRTLARGDERLLGPDYPGPMV